MKIDYDKIGMVLMASAIGGLGISIVMFIYVIAYNPALAPVVGGCAVAFVCLSASLSMVCGIVTLLKGG